MTVPPNQRVIPEAPTHTWAYFTAAAEADWKAAGIVEEDMAVDLSGESITPSEMRMKLDGQTLAQRYLAGEFNAPKRTAWTVLAELIRAWRKEALAAGCAMCGATPDMACSQRGVELDVPHTPRIEWHRTIRELPTETEALAQAPAQVVEVVRTADWNLPATPTTARRKWELAAAVAAEHMAREGREWDDPLAEPARLIYLAATSEGLGPDAHTKAPAEWPGWHGVRQQLAPDTIPHDLAEDQILSLWPSQVAIVVDPTHPLLYCRRALLPVDERLLEQIDAMNLVHQMVWITMEAGQTTMVDGRRRGLAAHRLNLRRLTQAVYALRGQIWATVQPPELVTLACRFTNDPDRVALIKDTANHGRLAEDLLRQADGVANLYRPFEVDGMTVQRSCREIAKLMGQSTQTVANLLSLQNLDPQVRTALEAAEFSVYTGYKLAREAKERQVAALEGTKGILPRERGAAIERFLAGDKEQAGPAAKTWTAKAIKETATRLTASKDPDVQQIGRVLAWLTGSAGDLKKLPKKIQRALAQPAQEGL